MKKTILALGLAVITSSSFAYDGQIDAGYTYADWDDNYTDSDHAFDVKGTLYFDSVQTGKGPLNEAAFLGHNSNVYAGYSYNIVKSNEYAIELNNTILGTAKDEHQYHTLNVGVEYFVEQFYVNGSVGYQKWEGKSEFKAPGISLHADDDADRTTYKALVGYLPVSNLLLAAGIDGYTGDGDDDNRFAVAAKYVAPLNNGQYINLEAEGAFSDVDSVAIGADFYFDQAFSVGAAYNIVDDGEDDDDFFTIRSKYFLNPNLAIGGQVGFGSDVQAFNINATFRF